MTRTGNATRVEINELTAVRLVHEAERMRLLADRFQRVNMPELAAEVLKIVESLEHLSVMLRVKLRSSQRAKGGV